MVRLRDTFDPLGVPLPDRILVCVAWPYANYLLHVGQAAGAYLPADIFARYHRHAGNDVLMVSGSDCHGTPITVTADKEGVDAARHRRPLPPEDPRSLGAARHLVRPLHDDADARTTTR